MPKRSPEQVLEDIENADVDDAIEGALAMTPEERRRALAEMGVDREALRARADAVFERVQGAAGGAAKQVEGVSSTEAARETGEGSGGGDRAAGIAHAERESGIGDGHGIGIGVGHGIGGGHGIGVGHGIGNGEKQKGEGSRFGVGRRVRRGANIAWVGVALAAGVAVALFVSSRRDEVVAAGHRPDAVGHGPIAQAALLRKQAYLDFRDGQYRACIELLDKARALDPAGDADPRVQYAREMAGRGLLSAPEEEAGAR